MNETFPFQSRTDSRQSAPEILDTQKSSSTHAGMSPILSNRIGMRSYRRAVVRRMCWLSVLMCLMIGAPRGSVAEEFQVTLHDGTVLTVETKNKTLRWTRVLENGELVERDVDLSDVRQLIFSSSSASRQVASVRRLLVQLGSSDYLKRQEAEAKLKDVQVGGGFKKLIKTFSDDEKYEVRHRVSRILRVLQSSDEEINTEFDRLTQSESGLSLGDAGEFRLECTYRGNPISLSRSEIRMLSKSSPDRAIPAGDGPVTISMHHQGEVGFFLDHQTTIDFETTSNGADINRSTNVNDMFIPDGLRLSSQDDGYIGVSGFAFKFAPLSPSKNSACVFKTSSSYTKRFHGIIEFKFCLPNQKSIAAGVHEFGVYYARVNHSRDFLVEAYDAHGQLLASVEATDKPCVFAGIKSTKPIAKVRILTNPYLFRVERNDFDQDYAIDDVCFSAPVALANPVDEAPKTIRLKNGDLLRFSRLKVLDEHRYSVDLQGMFTIELTDDEIESIRFANQAQPEKKQWAAMLKDGSILHVEPGPTFRSTMFEDFQFPREKMTALWWSRSPARYPESTDFENGKTVLVFPTCRIATDVAFTDLGFSWDPKAKKREQPIHLRGLENAEDPTVQISKIQYNAASPENIPTIWIAAPRIESDTSGRIRLIDGQQIVLDGSAGFKLESLQEKAVIISLDGKQTSISRDRILSIHWPHVR